MCIYMYVYVSINIKGFIYEREHIMFVILSLDYFVQHNNSRSINFPINLIISLWLNKIVYVLYFCYPFVDEHLG